MDGVDRWEDCDTVTYCDRQNGTPSYWLHNGHFRLLVNSHVFT